MSFLDAVPIQKGRDKMTSRLMFECWHSDGTAVL